MEREGSSITEGIGQGRITDNLAGAAIDGSVLIPDVDTIRMVRVGALSSVHTLVIMLLTGVLLAC